MKEPNADPRRNPARDVTADATEALVMSRLQADVLIVGGGLAGMVTALELLRAGQRVILADRHPAEHVGGLARWAFGGMALVGTPLQTRRRIHDSPEIALADWLRFGELNPADHHALAWARHYVEHSREQVYDWLVAHGLKFMPAVNWVERGRFGEGNSLPRYHLLWGTSLRMVECLNAALLEAGQDGRLQWLHQHRVHALDHQAGQLCGGLARHEAADETGSGGREIRIEAPVVVLAMGGINGSLEQVRSNWPADRPMPTALLNGAHPYSDGQMHHWTAKHLDGQIVRAGEMWNYAAGIPHPQPLFEGHGLSLIPCKSALWLDHQGRRIGPEPLVTGFDTHWLCQRVAAQARPWTWQLLNRRIALKEFAVSGAEHNPRIRDRQFVRFVLELLRGNHRLVDRMLSESSHMLSAGTLPELASKMNALTGTHDIQTATLEATLDHYEANFRPPSFNANAVSWDERDQALENDAQIRMIRHARQWGPDRLRTCKPAPLRLRRAGPFIAIHSQLITRKSLGGLRTDLASRVLDANHEPISGLYCVGEAAGFGGGGASGKRSLEGTFLPGCILTARAAARAIAGPSSGPSARKGSS